MIRDFLLSLVSFFVIDPFTAELNQKLAAAQAPAAIVRDVRACAVAAAPILLERAMTDWWWAGTTAIAVSVGMTRPEAVLLENAPSCAPALRAAQPFITGGRV
jgi:hypothetical protein